MTTTKKTADPNLDKDLEKYPVEPISESEAANERDVKDAVEELNPSEDSMDDNRG